MKPLAPIHWPYLGDGILAMAALSSLRDEAQEVFALRVSIAIAHRIPREVQHMAAKTPVPTPRRMMKVG